MKRHIDAWRDARGEGPETRPLRFGARSLFGLKSIHQRRPHNGKIQFEFRAGVNIAADAA